MTKAQDELRRTLEEGVVRLFAPCDQRPPASLFHYTRFENFPNIAVTGEIWASDVLRMRNDPGDGTYFLYVMRDIVRQSLLSERFKIAFHDPSNAGLTASAHAEGPLWSQYVACFSTRGDSKRLWDEYTDNGRGVAFEIEHDKFFEGANGGKRYALVRVTYDQEFQRSSTSRIIEEYRYACDQLTLAPAKFEAEILQALVATGARFKRPQDHEEDEWRLVIMDPDPEFAKRRSDGVAYREVSLHHMVKAIHRGPFCKHTVDELERELDGTPFADVRVVEGRFKEAACPTR